MKLIFTSIRPFAVQLIAAILFPATVLVAQVNVCANPGKTVYGLASTGMIYPIDLTTGTAGAAITPAYTGNAASQSNGMGYNNFNGKFYYFKRNPGGSTQEFVSFDPTTNTYTVLASCPTSNTVYTGCVSYDGVGFYTMDINAELFYYNINTNTWSSITSNFVDQFGNNISSTLSARSGGDIAIDGLGNLWILCSSASQFGLYRINASLPTSARATVNATQVISPLTATPTGKAFAGFAFDPIGNIYLATNSGDNKMYKVAAGGVVTFVGNITQNGAGNDLTSCSYPMSVLPIIWNSFTANLISDNRVSLEWGISAASNEKVFFVEQSTDAVNWNEIATVAAKANTGADRTYNYVASIQQTGRVYFRIRQVDQQDKTSYSGIKTISTSKSATVAVWPNPATQQLFIQNDKNGAVAVKAQFFDQAGRKVKETLLQSGVNVVSLQSLQSGTFVLRVINADGSAQQQLFVKQ